MTDRFRQSPTGFLEGAKDHYVAEGLLPYPDSRINPLGAPVTDLSLFILGDTHFHPPERESFDRTASLPSTLGMDTLRRYVYGMRSWHSDVRPTLYNQALRMWPKAVASLLLRHYVEPTDNMLIVHAGDIGADALNHDELSRAVQTTHATISDIHNTISEIWGSQTRNLFIQGVGDHDVDQRAWPQSGRLDQVRWFYDQFRLHNEPACFLQEVGDTDRSKKAILVIDTNLLEDEWVAGVRDRALQAVTELMEYKKRKVSDDELLSQVADQSGEIRDLQLYRTIRDARAQQEMMIQKAQKYDETIVIGHKPDLARKVAKGCEGSATVIAGHWHIPYNSDESVVPFLQGRTKSGQPIRTLIVSPATCGALGIEVSGAPTAYFLRVREEENLARHDIYTVRQDDSDKIPGVNRKT